jgi:amino acid transporter
MFDRFKSRSADPAEPGATGGNGRTAVAERPVGNGTATGASGATAADRTTVDEGAGRPGAGRTAAAGAAGGVATREHMRTARARQREEFGGINWGAAFFGWLVAVGLGALLVAILAAAGTAVGLSSNVSTSTATNNAGTVGLGGAIALLVVLMIAYYAGGYVAGRMSRFDGARQGGGAWLIGIVITLLLAVAAVVLGDQYNVLSGLNLPALPVGKSTMTTGGAIALAAVLVGTLIAAVVGGKAGERYHRKVDRAGFVD